MRWTKKARARAAALAAHEAAHATAVEQLSAFVRLALWTPNELRPAMIARLESRPLADKVG